MEAEYLLLQRRRSRGVHHGKRSPPPSENQCRLGDRGGESITAWAKQNGVSERTAFYWAKDPKVRREGAACRRRALTLPLVPCPASRRAWHNLVKRQAQ